MRVRILSSRDGHPCGAEVDVDDVVGANYVATGDAEQLVETKPIAPPAQQVDAPVTDPAADEPAETAPAQAPLETATADAPETAKQEAPPKGKKK